MYLFTWDGIPCVYYGTEQGFAGGVDPKNREDMFGGNPTSVRAVGDRSRQVQARPGPDPDAQGSLRASPRHGHAACGRRASPARAATPASSRSSGSRPTRPRSSCSTRANGERDVRARGRRRRVPPHDAARGLDAEGHHARHRRPDVHREGRRHGRREGPRAVRPRAREAVVATARVAFGSVASARARRNSRDRTRASRAGTRPAIVRARDAPRCSRLLAGCVATPTTDSASQAPLVGVERQPGSGRPQLQRRAARPRARGQRHGRLRDERWHLDLDRHDRDLERGGDRGARAVGAVSGTDATWREAAATAVEPGRDAGLRAVRRHSSINTCRARHERTATANASRSCRSSTSRRRPAVRSQPQHRRPANYVMTLARLRDLAETRPCARRPVGPTHANFVFDADFTQHRDGVLAPGGQVTIVVRDVAARAVRSDAGRHPAVRHHRVREVLAGQPARRRSACATARRRSPCRATRASVAVWFETTSVYGCHAFDSNYGNNYTFDAMRRRRSGSATRTKLITRDDSDAVRRRLAR